MNHSNNSDCPVQPESSQHPFAARRAVR